MSSALKSKLEVNTSELENLKTRKQSQSKRHENVKRQIEETKL
jgi:hypothetical protein